MAITSTPGAPGDTVPEPEPETRPSVARRPTGVLIVGVLAVVLVGVVAGLGVADLTVGSRKRSDEAAQLATSMTTPSPASSVPEPVASTVAPTSTEASPSTTGADTSAPASSSTTVGSSSTSASSTTRAPTTTVTPRTAPQTTPSQPQPSEPSAPAAIQVAFSQDQSGALVIPKKGTAMIQLTNSGGQEGQWLLRVNGDGYTVGQVSGSLAAGAVVTVTVTEVMNAAHTGSIIATVGANERVTIPLKTP